MTIPGASLLHIGAPLCPEAEGREKVLSATFPSKIVGIVSPRDIR